MKNFKKLLFVGAMISVMPSFSSAAWLPWAPKDVKACKRNLEEALIRKEMAVCKQDYQKRMKSFEKEIASLSAGYRLWPFKSEATVTSCLNELSIAFIRRKIQGCTQDYESKMAYYENEIKALSTKIFDDQPETPVRYNSRKGSDFEVVFKKDLTNADIVAVLLSATVIGVVYAVDYFTKFSSVKPEMKAAVDNK